MYGITDPLTFLIGTIFIVLLPGPNSMFVLTVASMKGVAAGYKAAMGVFLGDAILMAFAAMGAASVLLANPVMFLILKYAGAAYLGYIGIGLIKTAWQQWRLPGRYLEGIPTESKTRPQQRPFQRALLISLINPKAIFFFLSFFVQFVDTRYPYPGLTFLALGAIVQICSFVYLSSLIFAGSRLAHLVRSHPRISSIACASVGGLFLVFGIRLAGATLKAV